MATKKRKIKPQTKTIKFKTDAGVEVIFEPIFVEDKEDDIVRCDKVHITIDGKKHTMNYMDIHLFCYFTGNEEQRIKLADIKLKDITEIPYEVTIRPTKEEKKAGIVERLIKLPIDSALYNHIARSESVRMLANSLVKEGLLQKAAEEKALKAGLAKKNK